MLEFLILLEKKLPPGFEITFHKTVLGFIIRFRFGRIHTETKIPDHMIADDMHEGAKSQFSEMIFEDQIKKIRDHPQFAKQTL
jgi:hypothetical protein